MTSQVQQIQEKTGIEVTINGGEKEITSATILIRWKLSEEMIKKNPYYLIFFEQTEKEKNDLDNQSLGRRYACKATDSFKYIELFSPGYHRIMIMVVTGDYKEDAKRRVEYYLSNRGYSDNPYRYTVSLDWDLAKHYIVQDQDDDDYDEDVLASTVEDIEIPQGLFTTKPDTRLGKAIWWWVNLWFTDEPKNICDYKKRKWLPAFSLQPPVMLLWWTAKYGIAGPIYSSYIMIASWAIWFFGYRPRPILKEMWQAFTFERLVEWDVRQYNIRDLPTGKFSLYRVWSIKLGFTQHGKYVERELKYMPITPVQVFLILAVFLGVSLSIYYFSGTIQSIVNKQFLLDSITILGGVIVGSIAAMFIIKYWEVSRPKRKLKRKLKEQEDEKQQAAQEKKRKQ